MAITVRPAMARDTAGILDILNDCIAEGLATFETEPRREQDVAGWFGAGGLPVMVAEERGRLLGFAATSAYSSRAAYAGVREFSVYVRQAHRRRGIGRLLLAALCDANQREGAWKLVGKVLSGNRASLQLCDELGFRVVGVHHRHGKLDGKWRDVTLVERLLDENDTG